MRNDTADSLRGQSHQHLLYVHLASASAGIVNAPGSWLRARPLSTGVPLRTASGPTIAAEDQLETYGFPPIQDDLRIYIEFYRAITARDSNGKIIGTAMGGVLESMAGESSANDRWISNGPYRLPDDRSMQEWRFPAPSDAVLVGPGDPVGVKLIIKEADGTMHTILGGVGP